MQIFAAMLLPHFLGTCEACIFFPPYTLGVIYELLLISRDVIAFL